MYQGQYTFNTSHAYFNVSAYLFPKNMCNIMIFITAATNHNLFLIKLKYVLDQSVSISPRDHLDWRVVWSNYLLSIVWRGPAAISVFHFRMINISESVSCIQNAFTSLYCSQTGLSDRNWSCYIAVFNLLVYCCLNCRHDPQVNNKNIKWIQISHSSHQISHESLTDKSKFWLSSHLFSFVELKLTWVQVTMIWVNISA